MPYLDGILPQQPPEAELQIAYFILAAAQRTAEAFFQTFDQVRQARGAQGAPTDPEQDLLRAGLIFTTAGLDAMVKQLVRDALHSVLLKDEGATQQLTDYVETCLRRPSGTGEMQLDAKYLAAVLTHPSPREAIEKALLKQLTSNSLQSKDELLRVAAYFAIPARSITVDVNLLRDIFTVRNEIAHEMDVNFGAPNRRRRSRRRDHMVEYAREILRIGTRFLAAVQAKLAQSAIKW